VRGKRIIKKKRKREKIIHVPGAPFSGEPQLDDTLNVDRPQIQANKNNMYDDEEENLE